MRYKLGILLLSIVVLMTGCGERRDNSVTPLDDGTKPVKEIEISNKLLNTVYNYYSEYLQTASMEEWNSYLYDAQVWEIRLFKYMFDSAVANGWIENERATDISHYLEKAAKERNITFTSVEDLYSNPAWEDINPFLEPYNVAIMYVISDSSDYNDYRINSIYYYEEDTKYEYSGWYLYDFAYSESGELINEQRFDRQHFDKMTRYAGVSRYAADDPDFPETNPEEWQLLTDMRNEEKGEKLDVSFLEYILSINN